MGLGRDRDGRPIQQGLLGRFDADPRFLRLRRRSIVAEAQPVSERVIFCEVTAEIAVQGGKCLRDVVKNVLHF